MIDVSPRCFTDLGAKLRSYRHSHTSAHVRRSRSADKQVCLDERDFIVRTSSVHRKSVGDPAAHMRRQDSGD